MTADDAEKTEDAKEEEFRVASREFPGLTMG